MDLDERIIKLFESKTGYDKGMQSNQNLLMSLLKEYVTTISKISGLSEDFILQKIDSQLDVLRIGDFKNQDEMVTYDGIPVTSEEFKEKYRKGQTTFGAINIQYKEGKMAICIFDGSSGLSGINLSDLDDLKHTLYHELTHVLEKSIIENKEPVVKQDGSIIIKASTDPNKKNIEDYKESLSQEKVISNGLETIEYKQDGTRIVHNQISEGCTELITRMVLKELGVQVKHPERYIENVVMAQKLFKQYGSDALKTYLTDSSKLITQFLQEKIDGKSTLFYADEYEKFVRERVGILKDHPDISKIATEYIQYQLGTKKEEELLSGKDEKTTKTLKEIVDYKNKISTQKKETKPTETERRKKEKREPKILKLNKYEQKKRPLLDEKRNLKKEKQKVKENTKTKVKVYKPKNIPKGYVNIILMSLILLIYIMFIVTIKR